MSKFISKSNLLRYLIVIVMILLTSCLPYKNDDILVKYDDMNCLYYLKNEIKKYKYSDYIIDDVTNEEYKTGTPSIADYKTGSGMLDYDIQKYVNDRMDYGIKVELIKKYKDKVDGYCKQIKNDSYSERNSYIYFYDAENKTTTKLNDILATNISYDDEVPKIYFDINDTENVGTQNTENNTIKKIRLSDIIASNLTLDGYMKVILSKGKIHKTFNMDFEIDENTLSNIAESIEDVK